MPVQEGGIYVRQIKYVPIFSDTKAKFLAWKRNFLRVENLHGLFEFIIEGADILIPDEGMPFLAFQQAFPAEDIQKNFIAWNILSRVLEGSSDQNTLRDVTLPAARWRALVDTHNASTLGANIQCLQSIASNRVKPGPDSAAMIVDVRNMRSDGFDIEDKVVCLLSLRALPEKYNVFRQVLESRA